MRINMLNVAVFALLICGGGLVGCKKKAKAAAVIDPHSAAGVLQNLHVQGKLLNDALARKDWEYIHDFGYYFNGLAQAFFTKLDDAQRTQMKASLNELVTLASQLDKAAGGRHPEATEATVQRLQALLQDIDKQFQASKHSAFRGGRTPIAQWPCPVFEGSDLCSA